MVAEYLEKNYDRFFASYTALVLSKNYVTKRQSLKLLGEILLDRANFNVMTRYIANEANLKMMMNMLRDKSKNIQFEAFHVFKVRLSDFEWRLILNSSKGLCCQSEKAAGDRGHFAEEQGEAFGFPQGFPQRQRR
jgi:hypothetical protein